MAVEDLRYSTTVIFSKNDEKVFHEYDVDHVQWRAVDCNDKCYELVLTDSTTYKDIFRSPGPLHVLIPPGVHVSAFKGAVTCVAVAAPEE